MLSAIFGRELSAWGRTLLAWLVPTAAVVALTSSLHPQMAERGSAFQQKLEMMPRELVVALGIGSFDLQSPVAYLAMNFGTIVLLGAVFGGLVGANLIAREEAARTAELLLTHPVDRRVVALAKLAAGLALVLTWELGLLVTASATFAAKGIELDRPGTFVALFCGALLVHASVLALSAAASVRLPQPRAAPAAGMGVAFGTYVAGVIAALADGAAGLRWLSPYRYADPTEIVRLGGLPSSAWGLPAIFAAAVAFAVWSWARKDIRA